MTTVLELQSQLLTVVTLALLAIQLWAFVDAVIRGPQQFVAAGKLTKPGWLIILGLALLVHLVLVQSLFHLLNLVGAVAAIVYLVDARPAMRGLTRR